MSSSIEPENIDDRGERLREESVSFHTAVVHLYRGEMQRMTVWRQRLDVTSNWAILLTVGLTTFTLGGPVLGARIPGGTSPRRVTSLKVEATTRTTEVASPPGALTMFTLPPTEPEAGPTRDRLTPEVN